jgi:hypothetical protein
MGAQADGNKEAESRVKSRRDERMDRRWGVIEKTSKAGLAGRMVAVSSEQKEGLMDEWRGAGRRAGARR